jgi:acetyltransferase EpsM
MKLIVLGAGGHAQEILGIVKSIPEIALLGFVDETLQEPKSLYEFPIFMQIPDGNFSFICGVGSPVIKEYFESKISSKLCDPIVHPSSVLMHDVHVEKGVLIGANCSLTTDIIIGQSTSINCNCVISHNCRIGKRCHLSGGTVLSGNVIIGDNVYIGSNATIIPKICVGEGAIVGAGATVIKDVAPYTIVAGCPAKVLRTYKKGEKINL